MSSRQNGRPRGPKSGRLAARGAIHSILERLEDRRLLAGEVRLIGIAGQQEPNGVGDPRNETLFEIKSGTPGTTDPTFLDGFFNHPDQTDTVLSIAVDTPLLDVSTQGTGALRVDAPQGGFWGFASPNVVNALKAGASLLSYDMTLDNRELNGGSWGPNNDDFFVGFAQSNELAVVINTQTGGFIQRNFAAGGATDSMALGGQWSGQNGTRRITWDLTLFTSADGRSLAQFITDNNATEARFWFTTQAGNDPSNFGPARFYFDNFELFGGQFDLIGDFELFSTTPIVKLPFGPDSQSIGFNPDTGLLHRTFGASAYRNNPAQRGYNDNHGMMTIDLFSPNLTQAGVFNANYQGDGSLGPYGLPAPRPTWLLPLERRTDQQTDGSFRQQGPNEYHAARDLAWSSTEKVFFIADEGGIYKITPDGVTATFVGRPTALDAAGGPKGLTFFTVGGQRRLLAAERDGPNLWTIDPQTGQTIGAPVVIMDSNLVPLPGVLSLVEHPDGTTLLGIAKSTAEPNNPYNRNLVSIDPVTGLTTIIGNFGFHMADLAFIVKPPLKFTASQFVFQNAPHQLKVTFNHDVDSATLTPDDLSVRRLPGDPPFTPTAVSYDPATRTATFTLAATPLADGNYRATIAPGLINEAGAGANTDALTADFFVFAGDINRDRTVDFNDLAIMAQNYNQAGKTFVEGDFNYDTNVDFNDLAMLAQRYNTTLAPPAAAAPAPAAATLPTPTAPTKKPAPVFNTTTPIRPPTLKKPAIKRRTDLTS
jgi:hypothetical protein